MKNNFVVRSYKDSVFRMIFNEKEAMLSLYNALNHTNYTNSEDLEINTLENAIYMNMKNDISFVFASYLNLYEQQSTFNPNMPLRNLFYIARLYERMMIGKNIYGSQLIKLPTPRFVVFYNGADDYPEEMVLKLSDTYETATTAPELELKVTVLNISGNKNHELLSQCKLLSDYMTYVNKVRKYSKHLPLADAVERAVTECMEENVLTEFLKKNKAEAMQMSIFEYDEEEHMRMEREEHLALGRQEGLQKGLQEGLHKGETKKLIELICRKVKKGKTADVIADELEEDVAVIMPIYEAALKCAPDFEIDEIYQVISKGTVL